MYGVQSNIKSYDDANLYDTQNINEKKKKSQKGDDVTNFSLIIAYMFPDKNLRFEI